MTDDEQVERAVKWWYRHNVKNPPDSIAEIARGASVSEAVVSAEIAEARRLLDMVQPAIDAGIIKPQR